MEIQQRPLQTARKPHRKPVKLRRFPPNLARSFPGDTTTLPHPQSAVHEVDEERVRQLTFVINGATLADRKHRFTFRQDGALMKDTLTVNEAAETLGIPAWK